MGEGEPWAAKFATYSCEKIKGQTGRLSEKNGGKDEWVKREEQTDTS